MDDARDLKPVKCVLGGSESTQTDGAAVKYGYHGGTRPGSTGHADRLRPR